MNWDVIQTENRRRFGAALDALRGRNKGVPGLGLVHSPAGRGKSQAIIEYASERDAVRVEACALWTPCWMLREIAGAYEGKYLNARGTTEDLYRLVLGLMEQRDAPLIIDEADYLLRGNLLLAAVRDLHDRSGRPIVLVGNEDCARRLIEQPKVWSRISQFVEFDSLADIEVELALTKWTGLTITAGARALLTAETGGDFRLVVVAAEHLERAAHKSGLKEIDEATVRAVLEHKMAKRRLAATLGRPRGRTTR